MAINEHPRGNRLERQLALEIENIESYEDLDIGEDLRTDMARQLRDGTIVLNMKNDGGEKGKRGATVEGAIQISGSMDNHTREMLEHILHSLTVRLGMFPSGTIRERERITHDGDAFDVIKFSEDGEGSDTYEMYFSINEGVKKAVDDSLEQGSKTIDDCLTLVGERLLDADRKQNMIGAGFDSTDIDGMGKISDIFFNSHTGILNDLKELLGETERMIPAREMHEGIEKVIDERVAAEKKSAKEVVNLETLDIFGERIKVMLKLLFV
jgi:hypothetical protein